LLGAGAFFSHAGLRAERARFPQTQDVLYLPPPSRLRVMSLGYREAVADLVWIRAVIFAGDNIGGQNFEWIGRYLEVIFDLAPTFRRPYEWGGVTAVYSGEEIDREMVDRAITLYRRGLAHFPEDHEMLFALGMLLARDVQQVEGYDEVERVEAKEEGATLIRRAAAFGAPPLVRQLAATLLDESASDQLAIQYLESQLLVVEDEDYRRLLERKLHRLVGEQGLETLERVRTEFEARRQADLPYVSPSLYALISSASNAVASEAE
jgi:hypothetical protein